MKEPGRARRAMEGSCFGIRVRLPASLLGPTLQREFLMLILSRFENEEFVIGDNIVVKVVEIRGNRVRLGVQAPTEIPVHRREVYDAIKKDAKKPGEG